MTERVIKLSDIKNPVTPLVMAIAQHPHATTQFYNDAINVPGDLALNRHVEDELFRSGIRYIFQLTETSRENLKRILAIPEFIFSQVGPILEQRGLKIGQSIFEKSLSGNYSPQEIREAIHAARAIRDQLGLLPGQGFLVEGDLNESVRPVINATGLMTTKTETAPN